MESGQKVFAQGDEQNQDANACIEDNRHWEEDLAVSMALAFAETNECSVNF
jgi:hypothetical protein